MSLAHQAEFLLPDGYNDLQRHADLEAQRERAAQYQERFIREDNGGPIVVDSPRSSQRPNALRDEMIQIRRDNIQQLFCETLAVVGILAILIFCLDSDARDLYKEACEVDPVNELVTFIYMIMFPTIFTRGALLWKYREPSRDVDNFSLFSMCVTVFWTGSYGIWTLGQFRQLLAAGLDCANEQNYSVIRGLYQVTLILGAFPAIMTLAVTILACFLLPFMLHDSIQGYLQRRRTANNAVELQRSLFRTKHWVRSPSDKSLECCICLGAYTPDETEVTVLPCDKKHFFHQECIIDWLKVNSQCPLCKTEIDLTQVKKMRKPYEKFFKASKLKENEQSLIDSSQTSTESPKDPENGEEAKASAQPVNNKTQLANDSDFHQV